MKILSFIIAIMFFGQYAHCCGPYVSPCYLNNDEWPFYPHPDIIYELETLSKKFYKDIPDLKKKTSLSTLDTAVKDLRSACRNLNIAEDETEKTVNSFKAARSKVSKGEVPEDFSNNPGLKEFCLYIRGVAQMRRNPEKLPAAWLELLKLPEQDRFYRTSWTLYMLGNMLLNRDSDLAHKYYERLRSLGRKFSDSSGLAYSSYRNEYIYTHSNLNRFKYILACYAAASKAGDKLLINGIVNDLGYLHRKIYAPMSDAEKKEILRDPLAREMVLLSISLANPNFPAKTLSLIGDAKIVCAERLAWLAYYRGRLKECKEFLAHTNDNSMIKLWLQARFARREGNYEKAAKLLRKWLFFYENREQYPFYMSCSSEFSLKMNEEIHAVYGNVLVHKRDFTEALYSFLKASCLDDAFCLAEQVIALDDLIIFCQNHKKSFGKEISDNIEHLLARRLMRAYRFSEAEKWMPERYKKYVRKYRKLDSIANDLKYTKNERALAFYNLGKMVRENGSHLFSTASAPDYYRNGYHYPYTALNPEWYYHFNFYNLNMKPREKAYRYRGAQFMMRAAMLSKNINLKAAALYVGGTYIKYLAPDIADEYYKSLCDLRPLPFAVKCDKARWFPKKVPKTLKNELYSSEKRELKFFNSVFGKLTTTPKR
ncbi:MAG: hypothetical protein WC082_08990 [Victivallales bacterium]